MIVHSSKLEKLWIYCSLTLYRNLNLVGFTMFRVSRSWSWMIWEIRFTPSSKLQLDWISLILRVIRVEETWLGFSNAAWFAFNLMKILLRSFAKRKRKLGLLSFWGVNVASWVSNCLISILNWSYNQDLRFDWKTFPRLDTWSVMNKTLFGNGLK